MKNKTKAIKKHVPDEDAKKFDLSDETESLENSIKGTESRKNDTSRLISGKIMP